MSYSKFVVLTVRMPLSHCSTPTWKKYSVLGVWLDGCLSGHREPLACAQNRYLICLLQLSFLLMLKANPGYFAFNLDLHFSHAADSKVTTLYCKRAPADPGPETTTRFDDKRLTSTNRRLTTQEHSEQRMQLLGWKTVHEGCLFIWQPRGKIHESPS